MTLQEWLAGWPYMGNNWGFSAAPGSTVPDGVSAYVVPDSLGGQDRAKAWHLSDYLVSSVAGGSIWFRPRERCE